MVLASFPTDCRALIVEPEPVHAWALDLLLEEFGCRCIGPATSHTEIEQHLGRRRPTFALIDVNFDQELLPAAGCLAHKKVPFAVLTFGASIELLDRSDALRDRPRIDRPLHAPTLHAAASALCQQSLRTMIVEADQRIAEGRQRLAGQLERMAAGGHDTRSADALAREYGHLLQTMRSSRRLLARQLDDFTGNLLLSQRWGTKASVETGDAIGPRDENL
jgi:hypothetical protein